MDGCAMRGAGHVRRGNADRYVKLSGMAGAARFRVAVLGEAWVCAVLPWSSDKQIGGTADPGTEGGVGTPRPLLVTLWRSGLSKVG
jgi:hypothetical protein